MWPSSIALAGEWAGERFKRIRHDASHRGQALPHGLLQAQRRVEIGDYVRHRIAEGPKADDASAPAPATPAADDPYEALLKLGELRDARVITTDRRRRPFLVA